MREYIIWESWKGWGVWVAEKGWRTCEPLEIFKSRQQAEEYEQELLETDKRGINQKEEISK